jgi:hypothetical protein
LDATIQRAVYEHFRIIGRNPHGDFRYVAHPS